MKARGRHLCQLALALNAAVFSELNSICTIKKGQRKTPRLFSVVPVLTCFGKSLYNLCGALQLTARRGYVQLAPRVVPRGGLQLSTPISVPHL